MLQSGALSHFWDKVFYIDITIGKENYYETDDERNYVLAAFGWGSCDHFVRIDHYLRYYFFCEETQKQVNPSNRKSKERRGHHEPTGTADFDFSIACNKRRFVYRIKYS
jgi:hypothetical protein